MYQNDELISVLLKAISTHPSLDHKLHLMNAFEDYSDKFDRYEEALKFIAEKRSVNTREKAREVLGM